MKTFLLICVVVLILVFHFDFYIDGHCPRYQSSNYETGIGEIGEKCEVTVQVRRVQERYDAVFENEWTAE